MDRDTAVTRIQDGLGFRPDLATKIVLRLQEAQRKYEMGKTLPWFLKDQQGLPLTEGVGLIAFPTGYIREYENYTPYYYDDSNKAVHLFKKTLLALDGAFPDTTVQGPPEVYVEFPQGSDAVDAAANGWYVAPVPDADYTVYFSFYGRATLLDSNIENAFLLEAPELLIGEAGLRMAQDLRDADAVQIFKMIRDDAWDAVFRETIWREDQNRKSHIGEDL